MADAPEPQTEAGRAFAAFVARQPPEVLKAAPSRSEVYDALTALLDGIAALKGRVAALEAVRAKGAKPRVRVSTRDWQRPSEGQA